MAGHSPFFPHGVPRGARPRAARHLIAVPWRQAGLIAVCAVAGATTSTVVALRHGPAAVSTAQARMQAPRREAPPPQARVTTDLRLDLEAEVGAAQRAPQLAGAPEAETSTAPLRLNDTRQFDELEALLSLAPPAAGRPAPDGFAAWPGLLIGLLAGLLLAGVRELRGERMRSPREAEWALGVPVLGAIPTLSAKARDACLVPRRVPTECQ